MRWIDLATLALPRLMTESCIGSLLDKMDRSGYRLRWIFHLDVLPNVAWSNDNWHANIDQAERLARRFDDAILMFPTTNQSFGRSCLRVFRESRHSVLWIEDDWYWNEHFSLADVEIAARDGYCFRRSGVRIGTTMPSYWKRHVVDYLIDNYPNPPESATENKFKRLLYHRAGFRNNMTLGGIPRGVVSDVGRNSRYGGRWSVSTASVSPGA